MLFRFTSAAAGEVLMLAPHAQEIFSALGRDLGERGVIPAGDLADAMAKLQTRMEHARQQEANKPEADKDTEAQAGKDKEPQVAFHVRAHPFYQLLQTSAQAGKDVTWGI
ncbi:MAG: DUF1840 domain-containing protein [Brachymonas sp.]|nr:DUF1840 domain-containing protein [Brachymonas sp.]